MLALLIVAAVLGVLAVSFGLGVGVGRAASIGDRMDAVARDEAWRS